MVHSFIDLLSILNKPCMKEYLNRELNISITPFCDVHGMCMGPVAVGVASVPSSH